MTTLPEDWVSKFCFYFHCLGESKGGVHGEFSERGVWNTCLPLFPSLPSLVPWGGGERGRVCGRAIANLNRRDLWLSSGHLVGTYLRGGGCMTPLLQKKGVVWPIWSCDHFGTTYRINIQTGLFVLSAFLGFRFSWKKKKKKKWLAN